MYNIVLIMDIDKYLKIINLSKDEYKIIRFNHYKKKYGDDLQYYQFVNMIRCVPEDNLDNQFFHKYIKQPIIQYS